MVNDMCYIIPWKAMIKIPQCNTKAKQRVEGKNGASHKRDKRFITDIISIAIGTAATTLATRNAIQMHNLQREIKSITTSVDSIQNSINDYNSKLHCKKRGTILNL